MPPERVLATPGLRRGRAGEDLEVISGSLVLGVEFGAADPQLEANFGRCLADPWQILGRSVSTPGSGHCESDLGSVIVFLGRSTAIVVVAQKCMGQTKLES